MNASLTNIIALFGDRNIPIVIASIVLISYLAKDYFLLSLHIKNRSNKTIQECKELLNCNHLSEEDKLSVREKYQQIVFKKRHGIHTTSSQRKAIHNFYQKFEPRVGIEDIVNVYSYLEFTENGLQIREENWQDKSWIVLFWFLKLYILVSLIQISLKYLLMDSTNPLIVFPYLALGSIHLILLYFIDTDRVRYKNYKNLKKVTN